MKITLIILAVIIIIAITERRESVDSITIPNNSLRLRIIPNSNSSDDYQVKLLIKDLLERALPRLLSNANTIDDSKQIIENNLDNIDKMIDEILIPLNQTHQISYGMNYFPAKVFRGVKYESGKYDSLVVTIGNGDGDNWWCVLFPPLCSLERDVNINDVQYQFFVSRIINKFK